MSAVAYTDAYGMARSTNARLPELVRRSDLDAGLRALSGFKGAPLLRAEAWTFGRCSVLLTHTREHGYHLSVAHPFRYPTWDELADVRYQLVPDEITMGMAMPPRAQYVNLHANCLQLVEWKGWTG